MERSRWRALAFGALVCCTALVVGWRSDVRPASANQWDCDLPSVPVSAVFGTGAAFVLPGGATSLAAPTSAALAASGTGSVAAGTAAAAATAATGGSIALGAAVFLTAAAGTCKFVDWLLGDGMGLNPSIPATASSTGAPSYCPGRIGSTFNAGQYTTLTGFPTFAVVNPGGTNTTGEECWGIGWGTVYSPGWNVASVSSRATYSDGVTTIPQTQFTGEYRWAVNSNGTRLQIVDGSMPAGLPAYSVPGYTATGLVVHRGCHTAGTETLSRGVGGVCGVHPSENVVLWSGTASSVSAIRGVWPLSFVARQKGWQRTTYVSATCRLVASPYTSTTVASSSAPYWDREVTTRVKFPQCPSGSVPVEVIARRCPLGLDCGASQNGDLISSWTAPSNWATATGPAWVACLAAGSTCSDPVLLSGVCYWDGVEVPESFCTGQQLNGNSLLAPTTVEVPSVTTAPAGSSISTVTQPGTNTTGPTGSSGVTVVGLSGVIDTRGDTETAITGGSGCFPGGWGLFNPVSWVLQPIKCAVEWAFVPTSTEVQTRLAGLAALAAIPPLSYVADGVAWLADAEVLFVKWADGGPSCTGVMGSQICPRAWDNVTAPGWLGVLVLAGMWSLLAFAIFRSFS